ncbi:MAG: hypothetical protein BMS9Abin05_2174 [Rhodothermia bacterium]|nr:MAG: hypothetical protein BMS9Abin05_2174 [Rhodothermia bacterium]
MKKEGYLIGRDTVSLIVFATIYLGTLIPAGVLAQKAPRVIRLENNPIIRPAMLAGNDGENINGPSLIRVPDWVENPLGRYYLYFAHHVGQYIRLAYSDTLTGPWTIFEPGVLRLEETVCDDPENLESDKHVASPDVIVDRATRQIRLYYHCLVYPASLPEEQGSWGQRSLVATSSDGIQFETRDDYLGYSYFRVFRWQESFYALGMPGIFYRSANGMDGFEKGPTLFNNDMRHTAVTVRDSTLYVFYTIVGENPERIMLSTINLSPDWMAWKETPPVVVLEPEMEWEGAYLPAVPSERGFAKGKVRQLRDPALFEENGRTYLLYSVAGESGIAIAEIIW